MNLIHFAEFAHAVHVTEKIEDENLVGRESREGGGPDRRGLFAAHRFAAFRSQQLQPDRFYVRAKIEGFDVQRKRREIQRSAIERRTAGRAHSDFLLLFRRKFCPELR